MVVLEQSINTACAKVACAACEEDFHVGGVVAAGVASAETLESQDGGLIGWPTVIATIRDPNIVFRCSEVKTRSEGVLTNCSRTRRSDRSIKVPYAESSSNRLDMFRAPANWPARFCSVTQSRRAAVSHAHSYWMGQCLEQKYAFVPWTSRV